PDLREAAALYAAQCAICHGPEGRGDGPTAPSLDPHPANFHDGKRMAQRSLYGLYSSITLGVEGTSMVGFRALSDEQRWGLAFYGAGLGRPPADVRRGAELWTGGRDRDVFGDLAAIATRSPREIEAEHGAEARLVQGYLAAHPEVLAKPASLAIATSLT